MGDRIFPKVSVCMPVYNGEDYIAESIESVLNQTFADFEIVVCDNCSTDKTEEIVSGYKDPRITYLRNQKNLGLVGNANRCIEVANGEYVCILHHDDCMMPDNLSRKVRLLDEHPNVGFVHSNLYLIDSKGDVVSEEIWAEDSRRDYVDDGREVFARYVSCLHLGASIFIGAVLARRACYGRVGTFNHNLPHCLDSEMWMRMALFYDVACISTPLVKYRVHDSSTSSGWGDYTSLPYLKEHFLTAKLVFEKYGDRIPRKENLEKQVSRAFKERAVRLAYDAASDGNMLAGKDYFLESLKISSLQGNSKLFWKVAAMLLLGPKALESCRAVKKQLFGKHRTI